MKSPSSFVLARPYSGNQTVRIGFANGALRGLTEGVVVSGSGTGIAPVSGAVATFLPLPFLALLVAAIPFILGANISAERNRRTKAMHKWESDEYLEWNAGNFRLAPDEIKMAFFFEAPTSAWLTLPAQKLRLALTNDEQWEFTLRNRHDAQKLKNVLDEQHIPTRMHHNTKCPPWAHVLSTDIRSFF